MVLRVSSRIAPVPAICIDVSTRQGGDAGKMLERVQRGPFGGQHCPRIARQAHDRAARFDAVAIGGQHVDLNVRVQRPEERCRDFGSGKNYRLPRVHFRREAGIGRDRRAGRDVAAVAEILGQHAADKFVEIELGRKRHALAFSAPAPA